MPTNPNEPPEEAVDEQATDSRVDPRETLLEGQDAPPDAEPESEAEETEPTASDSDPGSGSPESAAPEEPPESDFVKTLQQLGFQDVEDEQTGARRLLEAYAYTAQQMAAIQEQSRQNEELARYGAMYLEQQQQTQAPPSGANAEEQPDSWWNPPKVDPTEVERWREVRLDENGQPRIDWKDGTPVEVKTAAEQHQRYVEKWAEDLVQRPHEVLPKVIEKEFDRLFEERWNQHQQAATLEEFAGSVREGNADWMYQRDPRTGDVMIDPRSGQPVLSEPGQEILELVRHVEQSGVTDPRTQWLHAVALYDYRHANQDRAGQQAADQARSAAAEQRRRHLKRGAGGGPSRRGGKAPPEEDSQVPADSTLSPGEQLIQQLQADGADFI